MSAWETLSATDLTSIADGTDGGTIDEGTDTQGPGEDELVDGAGGGSGGRARGTPTDAPDGSESPPKDVVFDILKNERRRQVLEFLREEPTTTLSDLAEHVAALENDKPIREITSSERKRVYVGLYQCHLPKMADAGVIDYERSRGTIQLREAASSCFLYLDIEPDAGPDDRTGLAGRLSAGLTAMTSFLFRR